MTPPAAAVREHKSGRWRCASRTNRGGILWGVDGVGMPASAPRPTRPTSAQGLPDPAGLGASGGRAWHRRGARLRPVPRPEHLRALADRQRRHRPAAAHQGRLRRRVDPPRRRCGPRGPRPSRQGGLVTSVNRYDPSRANTFIVYAHRHDQPGALHPAPAGEIELEDRLALPELLAGLPDLERRVVVSWPGGSKRSRSTSTRRHGSLSATAPCRSPRC
jgi:hypothetical protein